jgi:hypothetical protein
MKNHLFLTFTYACLFVNVDAQDELKNSIYLGYGGGSFPQIEVIVNNMFNTALTFGQAMPNSIKSSGVIYLGYQHSLSSRIALGGTFSNEKILLAWEGNKVYRAQSFSDNINTIMASLRFKYNLYSMFTLYGRADFGILWYRQSNSSDFIYSFSHKAFQLTPIGLSFGNALGGFCELGLGHLGIINFGIHYNFKVPHQRSVIQKGSYHV